MPIKQGSDELSRVNEHEKKPSYFMFEIQQRDLQTPSEYATGGV